MKGVIPVSTDLSILNAQQKDAILKSIDKNVVLLAGAGSGKTFTIVKRTEYLINDIGVDPSNIMLITFTNKAANEIKSRLIKTCGENAKDAWVGTFHSTCVRIIRMFGSCLKIDNFTIMDPSASKKIIKDILDKKGMDSSKSSIVKYLARISSFKNNLKKPSRLLSEGKEDYLTISIYQEYQNECWRRKSFDFDDLIIYGILLLSSYNHVKKWAENTFKYVMLDEAQDTCSSQFILLKSLCNTNNVMLIGDGNQSIYGFRDAMPEYLENFINTHPNTIRLKLEQNYRSTKTIIAGANSVVRNNSFGTKVNMFCNNELGSKIHKHISACPESEASWIASEISTDGRKPSDHAIIYRANYQSRLIEDALNKKGIPFTVFGSVSFYSRKEVRDLLSFCKSVINPNDTDAFTRALGTVKGIGDRAIEAIINIAQDELITLHSAITRYLDNKSRPRPSSLAQSGLIMVQNIFSRAYTSCSDIIKEAITQTGYKQNILNTGAPDSRDRVQIVDEFLSAVKEAESNGTMGGDIKSVVDHISLLSDAKTDKSKQDCVKLMTAHASKGLEFPVVFIAGANEGLFPSSLSMSTGKTKDIEEERRLFYVAMTRAEKELYILANAMIKPFSSKDYIDSKESRFIGEIPGNLIENFY